MRKPLFDQKELMIDTQKLHEETVRLIKYILFNSNHLFKTVTFRITGQHKSEVYEKSIYYYDKFVKKKKKKRENN